MQVAIDRELCQGHGLCFLFAPDLFGPDEEGHGRVLLSNVEPERRQQCFRVAQNCPERAIRVIDDAVGEKREGNRDVRHDD
jgi:ferredoxin